MNQPFKYSSILSIIVIQKKKCLKHKKNKNKSVSLIRNETLIAEIDCLSLDYTETIHH